MALSGTLSQPGITECNRHIVASLQTPGHTHLLLSQDPTLAPLPISDPPPRKSAQDTQKPAQLCPLPSLGVA